MAGRKPILRIGSDVSEARAAVAKLKEDARDFGRLDEEARLTIRTEAAEVKLVQIRERLEKLSKQEATPAVKVRTARALLDLERLEAKIERLDGKDVNVGIGGAITGALSGLAQGASGLLGSLPGVGQAVGSIGAESSASAPLVLLLAAAVAALVASLASAVIGLGTLAVALAGAFGPIVAVGIAAVAKLTEVFKALSAEHKNTTASAQHVASAHQQVASATDQVAAAQDNLKQQTTAAYTAWADSIENVKDDLLAVAHAQLGIQGAALSLREARQALKDFRAQAGAGGPGLDGLFRKLTDVNFKGSIKGALSGAAPGLSADDELQLERLILQVKEAKLGEKDATDQLHDSNVKLQRDRQTEAGFVRQGIRAYPGYRSAVQGLVSAQRALATAQHASATAAVAQHSALSKLSPVERQLAGTISSFRGLLERAFGPAVTAVLEGVNRGLRIFSATLTDPKIRSALADLGRAMGNAFVILAATLSTPAMRGLFVQLTQGAAQLVRILSSRVFGDVLTIFTRIAVDALPALLGILGGVADMFDRWAAWIREHPKKFKKDLDGFIHSTRIWALLIFHVIELVAKIGTFLAPIGDAIVVAFLHPVRTIQHFLKFIADSMTGYIDHIGHIGGEWGHAFASGFHSVIGGISSAATSVVNGVISVVNLFIAGIDAVIRAVNGLPHISTPFGKVGFPHIGTIDPLARVGDTRAGAHIPSAKLAAGGIVTGAIRALIGEAGPELVLPLNSDATMRRVGEAIARSLGMHQLRAPGLAPAFAGGGGSNGRAEMHYHGDIVIHVHSPAGTAPEPMTAAAQIEGELRRRGMG